MWGLYYRLCYFCFFPLLFFLLFSLLGFFLLEESSPSSPVLDEAFSVGTFPWIGTLPWIGICCAGLWTGSGGADAGVSVGTAEPVLGSVEPEPLEIGSMSSADRACSAASVLNEEFLVD